MEKIKIAVNGFGRIGRVFTRIAQLNPLIEIVAINVDIYHIITIKVLMCHIKKLKINNYSTVNET